MEKLSWMHHIETLTAEASHTLKYIRGNLKSAPCHLCKLVYEIYIQPQLECASATWNLHQSYLINPIEVIQNRAACFILASYHTKLVFQPSNTPLTLFR